MVAKKAEITVVMPAFNKSSTIQEAIRRMANHLENADFVIVEDGSSDDTLVNIEKLYSEIPNLKLIVHNENLGKGCAIRSGMMEVNTEFFAFLDADLDIHPYGIVEGLNTLKSEKEVVLVYGSKLHSKSLVEYPYSRRILSKIFRKLINLLFSIDIEDTQTGLKVGRTKQLKPIILASKSNNWLLDLEVFLEIERIKMKSVPSPINLRFDYTSTIKLRNIYQIIYELVKFKVDDLQKNNQKK